MANIGLDLGSKTLGIAASDALNLLAHPVATLHYSNFEQLLIDLKNKLSDRQIEKFILGYPRHLKGHESQMSIRVKDFKQMLEEKFQKEVVLIDERLSTIAANRYMIESNMNRKKRKNMVDQIAAVIILQVYLDALRG